MCNLSHGFVGLFLILSLEFDCPFGIFRPSCKTSANNKGVGPVRVDFGLKFHIFI